MSKEQENPLKFDLLGLYFSKNQVDVSFISKRSGVDRETLNSFKRKSVITKKVTDRVSGFVLKKIAEALNKEPGIVFQEIYTLENQIFNELEILSENLVFLREQSASIEEALEEVKELTDSCDCFEIPELKVFYYEYAIWFYADFKRGENE